MSCAPITAAEAHAASQKALDELLVAIPDSEDFTDAMEYCYSRINAAIRQGVFQVEMNIFPDYVVPDNDNYMQLLTDTVIAELIKQGFDVSFMAELNFLVEWELI